MVTTLLGLLGSLISTIGLLALAVTPEDEGP